MLFEVQDWLRAGKPVPTGGESPLALAAGKGFHSLVKVLLDQGPSQDMLDAALACAGAGGNLETCRLLLERGAGVGGVRAADVLRCGNPNVEDLLMTAGMDIETGFPLAKAITDWSKEALAFLKRWRRRSKAVRRQGAMALKQFVIREEDWRMRRVKVAGADPRLMVPTLVPRYKNDRWENSALQEAVFRGTFPAVLAMGVRKTDKLQELLELALCSLNRVKVMHVIRRGAKINDQANGGSSTLDHLLLMMGGPCNDSERAHFAWELTKELIAMGARWVPDAGGLRDVRAFLKTAKRGRCVEVARLLVESKAASRETVAALFGTPSIQRRLDKEELAKIKEIVRK